MTIKKIKSDYIIALLVFILFMIIHFYNLPLVKNIDSKLYKLGSEYVETEYEGHDQIIVVHVDGEDTPESASATETGNKIFELIKALNDKGAKLIGLTIPLDNEDVSPAFKELKKLSAKINAYPPADKSPGFKKWLLENLSDIENVLGVDSRLPDILIKNNNVIISVKTADNSNGQLPEPPDLPSEYFLNSSNIPPSIHERMKINRLIFPDEKLLKSALGFGHIVSMYDESAGRPFYPIILNSRGQFIPSLPLRMAMAYLNVKPGQVRIDEQKLFIKDSSLPLINGSLYEPVDFRINNVPSVLSCSEAMSNEASAIRDKVVFIGLDNNIDSYFDGYRSSPAGLMAAGQFLSIINKKVLSRPSFMFYAESILLFILIFLFVIFQSNRGFFRKTFYFLFMIVLIAGIYILCFSQFGLWFKAANIACGITAVYFCMVIRGGQAEKASGESNETIRLLGLNYQSQGDLDRAFDEFKKLPLGKESMNLIYDLGQDYEKKKLIKKALGVYKYINKGGGFRDLDDKIPMLMESEDQSSTMGSYGRSDESGILADPKGVKRSMVGRYKLLSELGKGSMGLVYKAQDPKMNRIVAIKTIKFSDEFDEDVIDEIKERFFMEAEIAGKLSHSSIVTIYDVGEDSDLTYMAMEFLEGEDLEKFIDKENLLPIRTVLNVIHNIAEALDFAHKAGVIHRDIKPANIMLLADGRVKVTDFGIAKAISSSKTKTGVILGTPNYMSPEQIMGQKINLKSDIFSLGVLFYQLLTGELPFHAQNLSGLLYQITQVKHSSPRSYNNKIPKVCEQIIDKTLRKDPEKRFKTAGDMAHVIQALADKIDDLREKKAKTE